MDFAANKAGGFHFSIFLLLCLYDSIYRPTTYFKRTNGIRRNPFFNDG